MQTEYLYEDGEYIYLNKPYAEVYISDSLFGDPMKPSTIASEYGSGIRTIGIFNIKFFDSENEDRNNVPLKTFNYPNMIETSPSAISIAKLDMDGLLPDTYRILKYYKGDIIMKASSVQNAENCEFFLKLLTSGKIPSGIKYDDVMHLWIKNLQINNVNPGVPYLTLQLIISELYRYRNDPTKQYRKVAGTGEKIEDSQYFNSNVNDATAYSSVFAGVTFERYSDKMASSLVMSKKGIKQTKSPVEMVVSM